jgi:nucleotide-binding universal stress UspA family protein
MVEAALTALIYIKLKEILALAHFVARSKERLAMRAGQRGIRSIKLRLPGITARSARAVEDAIPLLQKANSVRCLDCDRSQDRSSTGTRRGLGQAPCGAPHRSEFDIPKIDGSSVGKVFEGYVKTNEIELLVIGAHRHSRLREFVMGGATHTILGIHRAGDDVALIWLAAIAATSPSRTPETLNRKRRLRRTGSSPQLRWSLNRMPRRKPSSTVRAA